MAVSPDQKIGRYDEVAVLAKAVRWGFSVFIFVALFEKFPL